MVTFSRYNVYLVQNQRFLDQTDLGTVRGHGNAEVKLDGGWSNSVPSMGHTAAI